MSQILTIAYQYTQMEYLTFLLSYLGTVSLFFVLSMLLPTKYTFKDVVLSTTVVIPYVIFFITQTALQYFFGNVFSFSYSLLVLLLLPLYTLTMLFGMNEKSWIKITMLAVALLISLTPLVYTQFIPLYPAITFTLSYLLSTFFLIVFLKKYHA